MTEARSDIYDRTVQGTYHCFNNVVLGLDLLRERRVWLENRLATLTSIFAVDVLTFGVLETGYRSIVRNRPDIAGGWDDRKVVERWLLLNSQSLALNPPPTEDEIELALENRQTVAEWRLRLGDVSWFMKMLNEPMSRAANEEIGSKGHFWRDRFQMQVLTDLEALLACALFVDLNPLRESLAASLEESRFTGLWLRMQTIAEEAREKLGGVVSRDQWPERLSEAGWLLPISIEGDGEIQTGRRCSDHGFWSFPAETYLALANFVVQYRGMGREFWNRLELPPLIEHLKERISGWIEAIENFSSQLGRVVGRKESVLAFAQKRGKKLTGRLRRNGNAFG